MIDFIVTQGEWAVIGPNSAKKSIGTFGAAPCVILGIQDGSHCALMHIHEGNDLKSVVGALQGFVEASRNADSSRVIKAYICTDINVEAIHRTKQNFILELVKYAINKVRVDAYISLDTSAVLITKDLCTKMTDEEFVSRADPTAMGNSFNRAIHRDRTLQAGTREENGSVSLVEHKPGPA